MIDPTFIMPDSMKQRLVDGLTEALARRAEQLGSEWAAENIRKLSSEAPFRASADHALKAGAMRFVDEYREEDEDLVDEIMADTVFWQSTEFQRALLEMVQRPGAWMPDETDIVVRHFEWVQPQRLNRKRVDKAVSRLLGCIAQELWGLPGAREVREVYALQFQKLTAEAAREQVALLRQQLEATAQANQLSGDVLQALLQLTTAIEKNLLAASAVPALVASPKPYNNLPQPTYVRFVGRDAELAWLRERLSPTDRAWQIAINGIGGVGKTALALAVADEYRWRYDELPSEERFEAIIWVSAKEEVLTAQGRERADLPEAILHTLEDVYTAIARVLEREDITRAVPEEQDALVQKALQRQRTLFVMDNMESVEDDRIKTFLRKLPAPTKAIITSRDWIDVADVRVLRGLSPEDAEALIREEATTREVVLNVKQRERLYELTSGLPLPLKLGIARMSAGAGESFDAVTRWLGDAKGDLPEYCVRGQVDLVRERDPNAWTVLLACSLFDREAGASWEALGEIADLSLADRDAAIMQLQRLFLLNRTETDRLWVMPIVQRYVSSELSNMEAGESTVSSWINWMMSHAEKFGPLVEDDLEVRRRFAVEYPNVRMAAHWCLERHLWLPLLSMAGAIWHFPYRMGLYSDLEDILGGWLTAANELQDELARGRSQLQLARLMTIWDQYDKALVYLDACETVLLKHNDLTNLAEAWDTRSQIYSNKEKQEDARGLAIQVLVLGEEEHDLDVQIVGLLRLATIDGHLDNLRKAHESLDLAEELARQLNSKRRLSAVQYRRSTILIKEGNLQESETLLREVVETAMELGERRFIADTLRYLARLYTLTDRPVLARQEAEKALDLYERLGMTSRLNETLRLLSSLSEIDS